MVDLEQLRRVTQLAAGAKRRAAHEKKQAEEAARLEQQRLDELRIESKINDSIAYIDNMLFERARDGQCRYTYDCGTESCEVLINAIKKHYEDLNPVSVSIPHRVVANYDMDTYHEYTTHGITLEW